MSSKELWRILMLKPNLETLDISVLTGVPISLLTSQGREATYDVVMAIQMPAFLIVFWSWLKITRFYGWCEKKKKMFPNMRINWQRKNNTSNKKKNRPTVGQLRKLYKRLYGTHIPALNNEKNLKELLEEDPEERPDFDIALAGGQTRFFFTHDGLARRYEKMANYSIFKDVDNILIIAAEFIFELAQNTQFSIAPNVLVAPFSAIRATLMFLIIGSTDPPQNKAFWFVFILLSSCFLHNITAKVFLCTVTCNGNVETKKYEYMGHWLCSDMWSSSPRCP
ncbi:hypothetical protein QR680_014813 [Steinernema hermaphroditum]|uniref:Uncharacterized protein n=1 Tax=Steinernema hermaphroditum TaxID=289476 RepID=A0AA39ICU2_9BILA|nr:hypothetical protein QR680_014813 [Steinernema hermaphroditum]